MKRFRVTSPEGKSLVLTSQDDMPPSEQELEQVFQSHGSQPQAHQKPSFEDIAKTAIGPIYEPAKAIANTYGAVKESITEPISHALPSGGVKFPISAPLPIAPTTPIPLGKFTGRQALKELAGFGVDQATTFGLSRVPSILSGAGRMANFPIKNASKLTRGLADVSSKSIKTLREIGPKNVFRPEVESPEFIGKELAPKAYNKIKASLGIPDEEIIRLKDEYGGSISPFVEKISRGLKLKIDTQKSKIGDILSNPKVSSRINVSDFNDELSSQLSGFFRGGKLRTDLIKGDVGEMKEIIDMYKNRKGVFDKTEFILRRNRLVDLQQSPNGLVAQKAGKLKDALDKSAERFDFGGLTEAKQAYKQASEMESQFLNRSTEKLKFAESKIGRLGTEKGLPIQDIESLEELETYLGIPFIDEASKVNKIAEFESQYSPKELESLLKQAQNPENYQVVEKLKTLLGDLYPEIEKSLKASRIAKEFSPKGLYGSRAGIIRGISRSGLKSYEETVRPTIGKVLGKLKK